MSEAASARRIVVGVDGSAASGAAAAWAVREASLRDTAVHLVCACHGDTRTPAPYASASLAERHGELRAAAQALLDRTERAARDDLPADRLVTELTEESPARALLRRAKGAEMLVVGATRNSAGAGRSAQALGPVARACVRQARCPVVVVAFDSHQQDGRLRRGAEPADYAFTFIIAARVRFPMSGKGRRAHGADDVVEFVDRLREPPRGRTVG